VGGEKERNYNGWKIRSVGEKKRGILRVGKLRAWERKREVF
jgi:hypothetical protein